MLSQFFTLLKTMFERDNIIYPVNEDGEEISIKKTDEESEAEEYVLHKILVRPSISIFSIMKWILIFFTSSLGLALLFFEFLKHFIIQISSSIIEQINTKPIKLFVILCFISALIIFLSLLKTILIGLVHLYQKYSPESKRRSCLFKPTCSEYAILALNKYGVIRGIPKILDRFKRCHGNKYRIDYP